MSATCPTCNQPVPPPHGIVFENNEVSTKHGSVHLTQMEVLFFGILYRNIGRGVTWKAIFDEQYGLDPNGGPESTKVLDVRLYNMRSRLTRIGVHITTIWGWGVRLENPNIPRRSNRTCEVASSLNSPRNKRTA